MDKKGVREDRIRLIGEKHDQELIKTDIIKLLYGYEFDDDMTINDEVTASHQQQKLTCSAAINSESGDKSIFRDQQSSKRTYGSPRNISLITKTPNGPGKRALSYTSQSNQRIAQRGLRLGKEILPD